MENQYMIQEVVVEEGFTYDCHFKEWKYDIAIIKALLVENGFEYTDMGPKVGFKNIDAKTLLLIERISMLNESILWMDGKHKAA